MYALLSELLHDLLSLRLSSMGRSLVISATRITSVLDYSGAAISFIIYYLFYLVRYI
jgi:hypothetical protein